MFSITTRKKIMDVGQSFGGLFIAVIFQVISFVLLTRTLGVSSFGIFISAVAFGLALSELIGLGAGENFIRVAARNKQHAAAAFRHGLRLIFVTFFLLVLPLAPLAAWLLTSNDMIWLIAALIATEATITRTAIYCEHIYLGLQDYKLMAAARILLPALRCIAFLVVIFAFGITDMKSLIITQIAATFAAAFLMLLHLFILIPSNEDTGSLKKEKKNWLSFGIPVAIANLQRGIQFHGDKYLVTLVAGPEVGGVYAAGFRLIQMALLPIQAYVRTTYSGFFTAGQAGIGSTITYAKSIARPLIYISIFSSASAFIGAYFVVLLLGEDYVSASFVVKALAPVLIFWAFQYLLTDILMGAEHVWARIWVSMAANIFALGLLATLASTYGLSGVIIAVLLSTLFFVVLLALTIRWLSYRTKRDQT
ncbi:MAG: oligosaccharide flippase family protein [Hyphomicrobiales bacterium]